LIDADVWDSNADGLGFAASVDREQKVVSRYLLRIRLMERTTICIALPAGKQKIDHELWRPPETTG
jgi:hypothetical protein